ncbi:MAG: serine/threonine-protein kinase [Candidatus Aminicenantes bacterium]|jgi:serine/threonine protein kinase
MITGTPNYIPEALLGRTLGKYRVMEIIGRGGMGVVFKVWDTLEDRAKAIKTVPPEVALSPLAFDDLKREISMASAMVHPNVVKVLSLETQEGQYFIVMEYISGESLEKKIAQAEDRRLAEGDVIRIMKKAAEGIIEAHARNVIHRDLKPRNIMEADDGQVKILDFGISHRLSRSMTELTGKDISGTWPYMAPEQLSNRFGRENQQVDIWAFGVTMYQLLSGEVPFKHRDQIIDLKEKPFPLNHVSKKTNRIIMKCLEKNREKRYQHMTEVLKDLESVKIIPGKEKIEMTAPWETISWKGFLEWPRIAAAVLVIMALSFLFYSLQMNRTSAVNRDDFDLNTIEQSKARQEYEEYIHQAQAAADRTDYTTALSLLEKAVNIADTPRVEELFREINIRSQAQQIKTDSRQLLGFINSPAPREEKIKKSLAFLQTYNHLSPFLHQDRDAEILAVISKIQAYLEQWQLNTVRLQDLPEELVNRYYEKIRRIEIPGLPTGVRALGQVNFRLQVTRKGKISIQHIDDTRLNVTDQNQAETIKMMMAKKLNTISLPPPRDKSGAVVRITDWEITFKVGTFEDKIILLYEVQYA